MADENESEVRLNLLALQRMTTEELKEKWKALYGTPPPAYGDVFMRKRLAFRIQELFNGGYEWNGVYGSLSTVARAITGINRNGHVFFNIPSDREGAK